MGQEDDWGEIFCVLRTTQHILNLKLNAGTTDNSSDALFDWIVNLPCRAWTVEMSTPRRLEQARNA